MALRTRRPIVGARVALDNNTVRVTDDRREVTITSPNGQCATFRSARPTGFTDTDLDRARRMRLRTQHGQINRTRRIPIRRSNLYLHCNTGPPLWLLPRLSATRTSVSVGWLYVVVAITREPAAHRCADTRRHSG